MSELFSKQKPFGRRLKVELHLSNYATKIDLKNATGVDRSKFDKKTDLKSNVDKLDVDKLVPVLVDLTKVIDVLKTNFVTKYV